MKRVFICAKFSPDEEHSLYANIEAVKSICVSVIKQNCAPFAVHLLYAAFMSMGYTAAIRSALATGQAWIPMCQEVWQSGETVTPEMENQISLAKALGIPIKILSVEEK